MLTDLMQWLQIQRATSRASELGRDLAGAQRELERLQGTVDKLSLACAALWELLKERDGLADDALLQRILEIDLRDGVIDGRIHERPSECPQCGRKNGPRRTSCLYCASALPDGGPFG